MANRHLSRSVVMQSLYEWDFHNKNSALLPDIISRNIDEYAPALNKEDRDFVVNLIDGVIKKQPALDQIIEKAAHDWPIEQTPIVDRNVLRLGLYELLYSPKDEVPARVAINEAIELGKSFGGDRSGKFVNGVLGTIYKEMGEPGKNDEPKRKKGKHNLSAEEKNKLPLEQLGGAVVYCRDSAGAVYLAFVHDIFGHWTLSKGKVEPGENVEQAAIREIKEEINLSIKIKKSLGENEYIANDPEIGKKRKRVSYFLAEADHLDDLKLMKDGGLDGAQWFRVSEIANLRIYEDIRPIIEKGLMAIGESL